MRFSVVKAPVALSDCPGLSLFSMALPWVSSTLPWPLGHCPDHGEGSKNRRQCLLHPIVKKLKVILEYWTEEMQEELFERAVDSGLVESFNIFKMI